MCITIIIIIIIITITIIIVTITITIIIMLFNHIYHSFRIINKIFHKLKSRNNPCLSII
jgi:hypothetical protein